MIHKWRFLEVGTFECTILGIIDMSYLARYSTILTYRAQIRDFSVTEYRIELCSPLVSGQRLLTLTDFLELLTGFDSRATTVTNCRLSAENELIDFQKYDTAAIAAASMLQKVTRRVVARGAYSKRLTITIARDGAKQLLLDREEPSTFGG